MSGNSSGNRCGHDPHNSRLDDAITQMEKAQSVSPSILIIGRWLEHCYKYASKFPFFAQMGKRQIRSERREAAFLVLLILLRHLEPKSLLIGTWWPDIRFVGLPMKTITQETGLGLRRCERAISDLKRIGALEWDCSEPGRPRSLALTRVFFDWLSWEASQWEVEQAGSEQSDFAADGVQS